MAYSCLLGQPLEIHKIRANRKGGGLKAQHLTGIQLVRAICDGQLEGDSLGSSSISFTPRGIRNGKFVADTKTAGSVTLLLQTTLPCLFFTPGRSEGIFRGGTNAIQAPQVDYTLQVLKPVLEEQAGLRFTLEVVRRGYYPRGGGEVRVIVDPVEHVRPITMVEPGEVVSITVRSFVAGSIPFHVCERMANGAKTVLRKFFSAKLFTEDQLVRESPSNAVGDGTGIM